MARRLDLRALRCFFAVAEEGSIRKAAERLHMSQPPLSRAIRALEDLFGSRLFERNPGGVVLTPAGQHLARCVPALLAEADALLDEMRSLAADGGRIVRIGVGMGVPVASVRKLTAAWGRALRGTDVEVGSDYSQVLARSVREGRLEFAILALPGDTEGLEIRPLARQPLVAAIPAAHPAARQRRVRLRDLESLKLFWNARLVNPAFHDACAAIFRKAGFRPRYEMVPLGYLLTLDRIAHGEGFTLVNEWRAATRISGLAYRPLDPAERPEITIAAAWRRDDPPATLESLLKVARSLR
jgi:molybdate transport repressor ModE-like protein